MASVSTTKKIAPFLWFDDQAEEAATFYTSIFKNSKINDVTRYGDPGPGAEGSVMTVTFELDGLLFVALNGGCTDRAGNSLGSQFSLAASSAVSFAVRCPTQDEVDYLWEKLTDGGQPMQCGWLKDKYGVTWQIVPEGFIDIIADEDRKRAGRAMKAMMEMEKLDINALRRAAAG